MAGRGPAPKPAGQRRRRNKQPETLNLGDDGYAGEVPDMPACPPGLGSGWSSETEVWWRTWCRSPQAKLFTGPTWVRLRMLMAVAEKAHRGDMKAITELRLQEASLGATPADMLRLRIDAGPSKPELPPRRQSPAKAPEKTADGDADTGSAGEPEDERAAVLRLVEGG
ncbi:MAG: hypothetical protein S0880_13170 [Actinomycetota bacterium]|nr:hypothetical protein [Actinomycetota bacterium]